MNMYLDNFPEVRGIPTHMVCRETHIIWGELELKITSERYLGHANRFLLTYELSGVSEKDIRNIRSLGLCDCLDDELKRTLSEENACIFNNMDALGKIYPALDVKNLKKAHIYKSIEDVWHKCNKDKFVFPSLDANGIPIVPISPLTNVLENEKNKVDVIYLPLMNRDDVLERLVTEEEYLKIKRFCQTY